jgi:hypothetical protein
MESTTIERSSSGHLSAVQPAQNGSHPSEDQMKNLEQLIDVGTTILNQALDLLDNSLTFDEQLTVHSQYMPGSTIGIILSPPRTIRSIDTDMHAQASTFATHETTLLSCLTA